MHYCCKRLIIVFMLAALHSSLSYAGAFERLFAPSAELWQDWLTHDETSTAAIDYADWDGFLDSNVITASDGINRIDYGQVSAADHERLHRYLVAMQALTVSSYNGAEQKAYWINIYNAATVRAYGWFSRRRSTRGPVVQRVIAQAN